MFVTAAALRYVLAADCHTSHMRNTKTDSLGMTSKVVGYIPVCAGTCSSAATTFRYLAAGWTARSIVIGVMREAVAAECPESITNYGYDVPFVNGLRTALP
jgi:membrane-associated PAP2 superfamily phosphatase